MGSTVIQCEGVGKKYCKSLKKSMLYGAGDILQSTLGIIPDSSVLREDEFWAVDGIDFELKRGESLGIVGPNGSGKTSLLKMISGIFMPDKGKITVEGKIGSLIQVGAGFHPMLTGRENIYVNGAILGMSENEIDQKFDSIIAFADIGDFLDSPVKFYSSGMYVRLGFAIAIHCQPDVLLVDEVLAVGDLKFQSKCLKFITNHILKNGCSVIFVSHNRYAVQDVCQKAIYLNKGRLIQIGDTADVVERYLNDIKNDEAALEKSSPDQFSSEEITKVVFLDKAGNVKNQFSSGEEVHIRFYYSFPQSIQNPSIGISFFHVDPRFTIVSSTDYIFHVHSGYDGFDIQTLQGQGYVEVTVDHLYIPVGVYQYSVYLYNENKINLARKYENTGQVEVLWPTDAPKRSLIELPHHWTKVEGGIG